MLWVSSVPESKSYYEAHGFEELMKGQIGGEDIPITKRIVPFASLRS